VFDPKTPRHDHAKEIRCALINVRELCERLGMLDGIGSFKRQAGGLIVRCPWHTEMTPSCSIRIAGDGTIAARCHSCGATGDALSLVAVRHGLRLGHDFPQVLRVAAELAGLWAIVQELDTRTSDPGRAKVPPPRAVREPDRGYPPEAEVMALWAAAGPTRKDPKVSAWLATRGLDAGRVDAEELARAIPADAILPRWAAHAGATWAESGHRLLFSMHDAKGAVRSLRAGRVIDGDSPKRLPPGGFKAGEIVLANSIGVAMLAGLFAPELIVIAEGEPDFLVWATKRSSTPSAVLGIGSGSWCTAIAERLPEQSTVDIRTDHDQAGDRYAKEIAESLRHRCFLRRSKRQAQ